MEDEFVKENLEKINWLYYNNQKLLEWIKKEEPKVHELFNDFYNTFVKSLCIKETQLLSDLTFQRIKLLFKESYTWFLASENNKLRGKNE